ncbi:DNA/RNA non-specific endonuclease [Salinicola sp. JS01]|uniref:DNA/RNA non-specific endonuclease n=1 Tax=Salinicola sp. JS01 TaxID=3050071 RepID=UPI00255BD6A0|nr:DNA/RNA non-specific endonuclease [Salinicola sp. JS01]WIX32092.1 DNA/RNA non-specific endonuclease [Salinicola sp. JS01]
MPDEPSELAPMCVTPDGLCETGDGPPEADSATPRETREQALSGESRHVGNADAQWMAVTSTPDFCRVGDAIVGFDSSATLDTPVRRSPDVIAAGYPLYRQGDLFRGIQGDAGQHVVSGTSLDSGHVLITGGQTNVKINGLPVARHDSPCLINCNAAGVGGAPGYLVTRPCAVDSAPPAGGGADEDAHYTPGEEAGRVLSNAWEGVKSAARTTWDALPFTGDAATTAAARDRVVESAVDIYQGLDTLAGPGPLDLIDSGIGWAQGDAERAAHFSEAWQRTRDAYGGLWDAGTQAWQDARERNGTLGALEMSAATFAIEAIGPKGSGAARKAAEVAETAGDVSRGARRSEEAAEAAGEGVHVARRPAKLKRVHLKSREEYRAASKNPEPNTIYEYDGFTYTTDEYGRGISSSGTLKLGAGGNRFHDDRLIGHQGIEGDIGFHGGADEFGFQGGSLNVSPGNKALNSREYRAFERDLKNHLQEGRAVEADFRRVFNPGNTSSRPDKYAIKYRIQDGDWETRSFMNQEGG